MADDLPGDRLRKIRESLGLSRREAARRSEGAISYTHIGNLEDLPGAWHKASQEVIKGLARAYNLPYQRLISLVNGTELPPKPNVYTDEASLSNPNLRYGTRRIPTYDLVTAGPGGDGGTVVGYIDIPDTWAGTYASYQISGDSMAPRIPDRATVVIRVQDYASPNNIIVAWVAEEGMVCKYLSAVLTDGTHILTSFNPQHPPIATRRLQIYGVVREIRTPVEIINGNHP